MRGAIAAGHPLTAQVGAEVLEGGGNAIDAAIAACFTSFVCESPMTGPGGGGFMLIHDGDREELIDFFVAVPGLGREPGPRPLPQAVDILFGGTTPMTYHVGGPAVAVPGTLAGLEEAHARHGSMPWGELVRPAAALAREGIELTSAQAYFQRILAPILRFEEAGRRIYGEERLVDAGERIRMPELAATLELFAAEGVESFYRGQIAEALLAYLEERDGLLTAQDLASYRPLVRRPIATTYRDHRFVTNPPPSSGGVLIAYALALLELTGVGGKSGSAEAVAALTEVSRQASAQRDADFYGELYGDGLAARLLAEDELGGAARAVADQLRRRQAGAAARERPGFPATTHVSVVDSEGRAASLTTSAGAAPGMFIPGTGLSLNTMLGEADLLPAALDETDPLSTHLKAGERLTSMMSPSLLLRGGQPRLVLGSAGSTRLRSAIVQVVVNAIDHELPLAAALERPRAHLEGQTLHLEGGFQYAEVEALQRMGYEPELWPGLDFFFGGAAAVAIDAGGSFEAAGDSRRGGAGLVVS